MPIFPTYLRSNDRLGVKYGSVQKPTTVSVAKYDKYFTIFRQLLPTLKSKIAAAELPNHA